MTEIKYEEVISSAIASINVEYAEDLSVARTLLARVSGEMSMNPYSANRELQESIDNFLEEMAYKERIDRE